MLQKNAPERNLTAMAGRVLFLHFFNLVKKQQGSKKIFFFGVFPFISC
jgi:hypothetical protein